MPLIAREIVIKVTMENEAGEQSGGTGENAAPAGPSAGDTGGGGGGGNEDVISACVEQVMEILREKLEP